MPRSKRTTDYIFKRGETWWLRLQFPADGHELLLARPPYNGQRQVVKSLRTKDRQEALARAAFPLSCHLMVLMFVRNLRNGTVSHGVERQFEAGREHFTETGERFFATEEVLYYLNSLGKSVREAPNPLVPIHSFKDISAGVERDLLNDFANSGNAERKVRGPGVSDERQKWAGDDRIIETYISHSNLTHYSAKEARDVWTRYKELVGKPLSSATRDDGRTLAKFFLEENGAKSATASKKMSWLNSAVNLAISENKLRFNPFVNVVPKLADALPRVPFDDEDMAKAKGALGALSDHDQLLWILLATTGMRLGEAFEIEREFIERDVRYVIVGTKTAHSKRRIPIPEDVRALIPSEIKSPLFKGGPAAASKRLNRFISHCGIHGPEKVVHSLRHRAKDLLRAAECPSDIQDALLGHNKKTVADGYGKGYALPVLSKWVEKIGY